MIVALRSVRRQKHLSALLLAVLIVALALRLLPIGEKERARSETEVQTTSYYALTCNGVPMLYFQNIANDTTATGGATSAKTIVATQERHRAYWINQLPVLPSCYGHLLMKSPKGASFVTGYNNDRIHRFLRRQHHCIDDEIAGLQTQRNELRYYMRVHNVSDYGYNQIADHAKNVDQRIDSLENLLGRIDTLMRAKNLKIKFVMRYKTTLGKKNTECNKVGDGPDGTTIVQTTSHLSPLFLNTRLTASTAGKAFQEKGDIAAKAKKGTMAFLKGIYTGETKGGKPNGYGKYETTDGTYYEGHWKDGKRDGFGFYSAPHEYLQVGTWKKDVFKGERLTYTADRIYGIDISRHQHDQKGKVYPIDWARLRITSLGKLSEKEVSGKVDYPVTFIYIKSTEGTTVYNNYYAADYRQARAHGIHTGSYHFFSTLSPAREQAAFFLKKSYLKKGDLPPVLDVEPLPSQIQKMGGTKRLFSEVRTWLRIVEKRTGRKPILYINQMFVNKYLDEAPDIEDNYLVWIARYGEYKPNVKLKYWQLSPDGGVRGIRGDVDINVFNGFAPQFADFLSRHAIGPLPSPPR